MERKSSQTLLVDADDTLWENNIYFERVIHSVQELLETCAEDCRDFRIRLNEMEREHTARYGYGTANFARSLVATCEQFIPAGNGSILKAKARELAMSIMNHPLELLEGVPETLEYLAGRHALVLVTKGDAGEQLQKIDQSGLKHFFRDLQIVPEKNAALYRRLVETHGWDPDRTWMIGNSPRSDINPALSAGINAVYIPHPHTWALEHEEPAVHSRLVEVVRFADLRSYF